VINIVDEQVHFLFSSMSSTVPDINIYHHYCIYPLYNILLWQQVISKHHSTIRVGFLRISAS